MALFDPAIIKQHLLNTGLQQKDARLFQVLNELILSLEGLTKSNNQLINSPSGDTIINQNLLQLVSDFDSVEGEMGPPGLTGARGATGLTGPAGPIIYLDDIESPDLFPPIVGPQGNPGTNGSSGTFTEQTSSSTGTQNNFDLNAILTYLRWTGASAVTFTGFKVLTAAPVAGDQIIIENIGSSTISFTNQDTGSTAAHRIITVDGLTQVLGIGGRAVLIYDDTTDRWRLKSINNPIWDSGPWEFDPQGGNVARIRPSETAGTYNDYNPTGLASCIQIELEPAASGAVVLTGLVNNGKTQNIYFRNRDSGGGTITFKHRDSGSTLGNRFRCPLSVDFSLRSGEAVLIQYDTDGAEWCFLAGAPLVSGSITTGVVGNLFTLTTRLTDAQIKTLNSAPVTVVPAVSGRIIVPLQLFLVLSKTAGYNTNSSLNLRWSGIANDITTVTTITTIGTGTTYSMTVATVNTNITSNPTGVNVVIRNNGDLTSGNVANFMDVTVVYQLI